MDTHCHTANWTIHFVSADPVVSHIDGVSIFLSGTALHCSTPLASLCLPSPIWPTYISLIASKSPLPHPAGSKSAEVLLFGHDVESMVPIFSCMDDKGSLLVLDKRVPGPISVA